MLFVRVCVEVKWHVLSEKNDDYGSMTKQGKLCTKNRKYYDIQSCVGDLYWYGCPVPND